ncbi:pyrimidine 5'-nucleotidase [Govanella unica]|uniref:Pyrimidine 5'-nucleotidase n=1 Tax=Govanella unica TaxID=2975056 RepID=A0A9X3Z6F3_9PROT|nr:pyrimidine 5'-nucleotidase [Govania unica]MDA5192948.1 pyrimidine 5'-nucleotidase [Govania unica]
MLFQGRDTWVFDLDNTLYPGRCNLFAAIDQRMTEFVMRLAGLPHAEARRLQKSYYVEYGTTLRGLMLEHALDPAEFLAYVHDIDVSPVDPNPRLGKALAGLAGRKIIFTNGSVAHAERVLDRLGVRDAFSGIYDICAASYLPKPRPEPYAGMLVAHDIDPTRAVMVEDIIRNLEPAAALGMETVWVTGGDEWARAGVPDDRLPDYVHHQVDDLTAWLESLLQVAPS